MGSCKHGSEGTADVADVIFWPCVVPSTSVIYRNCLYFYFCLRIIVLQMQEVKSCLAIVSAFLIDERVDRHGSLSIFIDRKSMTRLPSCLFSL